MPNLKKRLNSLPFITYIHSTMSNIFFLLYFTYLISFVTLENCAYRSGLLHKFLNVQARLRTLRLAYNIFLY